MRSSNNVADRGLADRVLLGKLSLRVETRRVVVPNATNGLCFKLSRPISLSALVGAIQKLVSAIGLFCIPANVTQHIGISALVREVPTVHASGPWTNKRLQNQAMSFPTVPLGVSVDDDLRIPISIKRLAEFPPRPHSTTPVSITATPDRTITASAVAGEVRDVSILNGRIKLRHGSHLLQGRAV